MSAPQASAYNGDKRVKINRVGGQITSVVIPEDDGKAWRIERVRGTDLFVARAAEGHYVTDPGDKYNRRRNTWTSVDEAIRYVIGDPQ